MRGCALGTAGHGNEGQNEESMSNPKPFGTRAPTTVTHAHTHARLYARTHARTHARSPSPRPKAPRRVLQTYWSSFPCLFMSPLTCNSTQSAATTEDANKKSAGAQSRRSGRSRQAHTRLAKLNMVASLEGQQRRANRTQAQEPLPKPHLRPSFPRDYATIGATVL
jgi:hypothetical protein